MPGPQCRSGVQHTRSLLQPPNGPARVHSFTRYGAWNAKRPHSSCFFSVLAVSATLFSSACSSSFSIRDSRSCASSSVVSAEAAGAVFSFPADAMAPAARGIAVVMWMSTA